jgi:hypothetical protein
VGQFGDQERLEKFSQRARIHDHRIAPGDQDVGDLRVHLQVVHQFAALARIELQVIHADELRPAKAKGAIGVAGLAGAGEEQHRFLVLVLA